MRTKEEYFNLNALLTERSKLQTTLYDLDNEIKKHFNIFQHLSVESIGEADIEFYMSYGHFNFSDQEELLTHMLNVGFKLNAIYDVTNSDDFSNGLFLNFVKDTTENEAQE